MEITLIMSVYLFVLIKQCYSQYKPLINKTGVKKTFSLNVYIYTCVTHSCPTVLPRESLSQVGSTCLQTSPAARRPAAQS